MDYDDDYAGDEGGMAAAGGSAAARRLSGGKDDGIPAFLRKTYEVRRAPTRPASRTRR